jgi:hypothetical protein
MAKKTIVTLKLIVVARLIHNTTREVGAETGVEPRPTWDALPANEKASMLEAITNAAHGKPQNQPEGEVTETPASKVFFAMVDVLKPYCPELQPQPSANLQKVDPPADSKGADAEPKEKKAAKKEAK